MKIKKGDNVLIISGKDKGKKGKVIKVLPGEGKIIVEGMNLRKKHVRPKREGEKGQIVSIAAPMDASNVLFICPQCNKGTKIGYKVSDKKKYRVCKKCKSMI
ncbi:MAG TPA: 50S ribosomal protein L24 [Candidatus Pacearchaeota archaeon]|nr:50S ribosomal protein L24 [Candidatus Paceibacterota bacterium]HOK00525.1 50S ribosomal protein L24 [Candidatus Pacearchaeota archaeon]HOL90348.1 50S ribosomal protein L24 [Candidatus Pacearchaeota archaeon]HPO68550.1 50S ribosomal protein L24 [Candidatus Pacearchaeota archaeon]